MLLAFDAHYTDTSTRLIAASFNDWADDAALQLHEWTGGAAADYEPGKFYLRELPFLLDALKDFDLTEINAIVVDGYVYLDASGRLGLGGHLYQALREQIPVIGVAKNYFRDTNAEAVIRGESNKPLYVTAYGMTQQTAAEHLRTMSGPYRMPTILAQVDQATKRKD